VLLKIHWQIQFNLKEYIGLNLRKRYTQTTY